MKLIVRYYFIAVWLIIACSATAQQQVEHPYRLWTIDISNDNKYIATGGDDSLLQVLNNDFSVYRSVKLSRQGMIRFVSWHPAEHLLAIASMNNTWIYNPETWTEIPLEGKKIGSRTAAWNHNGELLASADGAGTIMIWNKKGQLLRQIIKTTDGRRDDNSFLGLDWHPSKDMFVTVGDEIRIYDTSGKELKLIRHRKQQAGILTVKWHPAGEFFVTGDYGHPGEGIDNYLQFWKADGSLIRTMKQSKAEFRNIRWNKDGTLLATASDALRIWNRNGKLLYTSNGGNKDNLWGVDWNSDGKKLVTVSADNSGMIQTWTNTANWIASFQ